MCSLINSLNLLSVFPERAKLVGVKNACKEINGKNWFSPELANLKNAVFFFKTLGTMMKT